MGTILSVFAHPDDETFICGGTLAKYASEGHRVVLLCATKGEMGRRMGDPPVATRESLPVIREQELFNACQALKISNLRFLGLRDKLLEIHPFETLKQMVLVQMTEIMPDAVITFHEILGGHPDHCAIGRATKEAFTVYKTKNSKANLFYVCWSNVAQDPRSYGFSQEQITKITIRKYLLQKLYGFRAHQTQSSMDEWVWGNDQETINHFSEYEYFIQANEPFGSNKNSII
ncbi:PIG-L family deacetylase [Metabacillus sp. Hm71]|uniref:PIG-L family deacetylase n=1 Tax=Metabacillus sp. Hm71 TaxID=3450743 RepID=UPI003F42F65C